MPTADASTPCGSTGRPSRSSAVSVSGGPFGPSPTHISSRTRHSQNSSSLGSSSLPLQPRVASVDGGLQDAHTSRPNDQLTHVSKPFDAPRRKRKHAEHAEHAEHTTSGAGDRWVYLVCFDEPFRPVLADRALLNEYDCRLAKHLSLTPPDCEVMGEPAWWLNTGRDMLVAFLKSLVHHEFVIPKDISYLEAVRHFEYEGIAVPGNQINASASDAASIGATAYGISVRKQTQTRVDALQQVVQRVASAIGEWPRLDIGVSVIEMGNDGPGFACTGSRAWISFAHRPHMERYGGDEMHALATKRPLWLVNTLCGMGYVHWRLTQAGRIDGQARNEKAFTILAREGVENDSTYSFVSVKRDWPRQLRESCKDKDFREMCRHTERWASWVLTNVVSFGRILAERDVPQQTKYARASVSLAEKLVREAPNCARLFSGMCAVDTDKKDTTPERRALEKALKAQKIKVVAWKNAGELLDKDIEPLIFPPSFHSVHVDEAWRRNMPCVLIEADETC